MTETAAIPLPLPALMDDWQRHLRAANKAPLTIRSYLQIGGAFASWLTRTGGSHDARDVGRVDVETYLIEVRESTSAANSAKHFRTLQQLFRWLVDVEGELPVSPMARIERPTVPVKPVPVIPDDLIARLLKACVGADFAARRDTAIIRLLLDTGMRCGELAGLTVEGCDELGRPTGLDWRYEVAHVIGKGDKTRACPFGAKTANALRRYLRGRAQHPHAGVAALWVGRFGALTESGIAQMLERRCGQACIDRTNPHRYRHTAAHQWLLAGGQETDLMRLMGWSSREMVARYGASAADERARQAHQRLSLGDRI
ncbi:MAG: tyrosine-type recombinase/integrase [Actinocrinis sp.]